jgi:hypothetical protein
MTQRRSLSNALLPVHCSGGLCEPVHCFAHSAPTVKLTDVTGLALDRIEADFIETYEFQNNVAPAQPIAQSNETVHLLRTQIWMQLQIEDDLIFSGCYFLFQPPHKLRPLQGCHEIPFIALINRLDIDTLRKKNARVVHDLSVTVTDLNHAEWVVMFRSSTCGGFGESHDERG